MSQTRTTTIQDIAETIAEGTDLFMGVDSGDLLVDEDQHPLTAMQGVEHLTTESLGFIVYDSLGDEYYFIKHAEQDIWLQYQPSADHVYAVQTETLPGYIEIHHAYAKKNGQLQSGTVICPTDLMPKWGKNPIFP
jgi:hypothetical protein